MQGQSIGRYIDEGEISKRRYHKEFPEEQAKYIYFHILDSLNDRTLKISNFDLSILIFNLDDFQCHLQRRGLFMRLNPSDLSAILVLDLTFIFLKSRVSEFLGHLRVFLGNIQRSTSRSRIREDEIEYSSVE